MEGASQEAMTCRGGPPWPPLFEGTNHQRMRGGHGGPPLHVILQFFLFLSSSFLYKFQRGRIHTITKTSGFGTIIEHVSQMSVASAAQHLIPLHPVAMITLT